MQRHSHQPDQRLYSGCRTRVLVSLALSAPLLAALLLAPAPVRAADPVPVAKAPQPKLGKKSLAAVELSKEQRLKFQQILQGVDTRVSEAAKDDPEVSKMRAELRAIAAQSQPAAKRKAIDAYQKKHKARYQSWLTRAKVDLNAVAQELDKVHPELKVQVQANLGLAGSQRKLSDMNPLPPVARPHVTSIAGSSFVNHDDLSCGAISGAGVTFGNDSVANSIFAAVAGGCTNEGERSVTVRVPDGAASASVQARSDLHAEAFAVGVAGLAASYASASLANEPERGEPKAVRNSVFVSVFAPILWSAYSEENLEGQTADLPLSAGESTTVEAVTSTYALAAVGAETHAAASVKKLRVLLVVEHRP